MKRGTLAAGLAAVIMWGLAPVATRAAVAHLSPLPLLTIRMTAATLVLLPWAVPLFRRLRARSAGRLAAAGLLGLVGYNLPVTAGLRWLPAATAGLLLATEPVWVMVLGRVFLGERGGLRAWLGSGIALAGVAVLAGPGAVTGVGGYRALAGTGLVLAGTLAFAAYTIVLRPLSQEFGAVPATAASTAVGTLPYLAFAGMLPGAGLGHLGAAVWGELAFLALGSTAAGMLLWNVAVLSGGAARVSLLLYLEPVVSVLGAAVFLGEQVTAVTIGGGVLILGGVAVASSVPAGDITRPFRKVKNIIQNGLAALRLPQICTARGVELWHGDAYPADAPSLMRRRLGSIASTRAPCGCSVPDPASWPWLPAWRSRLPETRGLWLGYVQWHG